MCEWSIPGFFAAGVLLTTIVTLIWSGGNHD